jgi:formate dehydrogenase subunit delta
VSAQSADKLVYMANQIARFFAVQPGQAAAQRTADHLVSFWAPPMREAIVSHLDAGGAGLAPTAKAAVELLARRTPAEVEQELAALHQPSTGRQPGDDAG